MTYRFTALDFVVLLLYLVGTTALGVWLGRGQRTARDYFVAGHRIPWWAILFSVVATETSALTFISIPGLAYATNLSFLQIAAGYIVGRIVIAYTLLPRYFQGELVTAYALLERRFGQATRRFASVTFMATRAFGDSVRLFATSIPIALILGPVFDGPVSVGPFELGVGHLSILILGAFTLLYTYHGGMRAVIWTDVIQTGVYVLGGLTAMYLIGRGVDGGWSEILTGESTRGKLRVLDPYPGLDRANTLWAGLIGGAFLSMASHGADQLIVQRLLASSNLADARRSLVWSGVAVFVQFALFLTIGIGLFAFYQGRAFPVPDEIFPRFIIEVMPPGLTGVVIAAILAAAMSTISSSLNSLSAATTHDLFVPLTHRDPESPYLLRIGKLFTLAWAVVLIGAAMLYPAQGTPVVVMALSIASFTYGGLLGGFFLALFWGRARQRDAIVGMAVGILSMAVVVSARMLIGWSPELGSGILGPLSRIAWPWYVLIGTTITLLVGIVSSLIGGRRPDATAHPDVVPTTTPGAAVSGRR